jgi:hypothetical protein
MLQAGNCTQHEGMCIYIFFHRIMVGAVVLTEFLLLSK